jgi:hypothetical protein
MIRACDFGVLETATGLAFVGMIPSRVVPKSQKGRRRWSRTIE